MYCPLCGSVGIVIGVLETPHAQSDDSCSICGYSQRKHSGDSASFDELALLQSGLPANQVIAERIRWLKSKQREDQRDDDTDLVISILEKMPRNGKLLREKITSLVMDMEVSTVHQVRTRLYSERKVLGWLLAVLEWKPSN